MLRAQVEHDHAAVAARAALGLSEIKADIGAGAMLTWPAHLADGRSPEEASMLPTQIGAMPGRTFALLYLTMMAGTVLIALFADALHAAMTRRSH